ncbi:hypothetical protein D9M68_1000860 [compost metagenome]
MLRSSFDSNKGQIYALPKEREVVERYVDLDELKVAASNRLQDGVLEYPVRAAWRALLEGRAIYGKDGSLARN